MNVSLPPALAGAIEQRLEGVSRKDLAARASEISEAYRAGGSSRSLGDDLDILAYLVTRLPATYAAAHAVFGQVRETLPAFAPERLLDVGAGTGAASWAAVEHWPSLRGATLLDRDARFLTTARELGAQHAILANADHVAAELESVAGSADLVVANYLLAELGEDKAVAAARTLFEASTNLLVLVEPGTPAGFARIRAARAALLEEGAHVVAPCTHDKPCPMQAPDWCHFSQRLPRSRDHMQAKEASVPFEDERYSYVAVSRHPVLAGNRARIVAQPEETKAGLILPLCDSRGLHGATLNRRDRVLFNLLKKAKWGDVIVSED